MLIASNRMAEKRMESKTYPNIQSMIDAMIDRCNRGLSKSKMSNLRNRTLKLMLGFRQMEQPMMAINEPTIIRPKPITLFFPQEGFRAFDSIERFLAI